LQDLIYKAGLMGVQVNRDQAQQMLCLLDELEHWNRAYNLTAISVREQMRSHHLLDSLSIAPLLQGTQIIDVGTGAGFPGLPLAIITPQRQFTLLDSNGKKVRFIAHVSRVLGLKNVVIAHSRAENFLVTTPFDTVLARAFSALPTLLSNVANLCGSQTRVLAMKGRRQTEGVIRLPAGWRIEQDLTLMVPDLNQNRHVLVVRAS